MSAPNDSALPESDLPDPLEDYEPPHYDDPLEEALDTRTVLDLQTVPCETVPSTATIETAVGRLVAIEHACLLVEENGKLVGLFTDRDLLKRVALEYPHIKDQPVSSVMTKDPVYVNDDDAAAAALHVIAVSGHRHVPVLKLDGTIAGVITPRRITAFLLQHSK